jgi:hypothetical protein
MPMVNPSGSVKMEGFNPPDVQSFIVLKKNHALSRNGKAFLSLLAGARRIIGLSERRVDQKEQEVNPLTCKSVRP